MANKNEMFEGGLVKLGSLFSATTDAEFDKASSEIAKKVETEKNAEKVASIISNQKGASSK